MSDLIDREELLKAMDTWDKFGCDANGIIVRYSDELVPYVHYEDMIKCAKGMPSAGGQYENVRTDEYNRIIGFLKYNRFCIVDNNGDYYSIEEIEEQLKEI